jgi:hypothetical protein
MAKVKFDFKKPDMTIVRSLVIQRLREHSSFNCLDATGIGFLPYVDMSGSDISRFGFLARDVCWQFLCNGILAPGAAGQGQDNPELPSFHLTAFGRTYINTGEWPVYDPDSYLARIAATVGTPDQTALAYLRESLASFERGGFVASAVMLGIAAERVFLLICEATCTALSNPTEQKKVTTLLKRFPIKPKLEWLHREFTELQTNPPKGFPDNASLVVTGIYDLLRTQRNDLGHPREVPPRPEPEEVYNSLQLFPRYMQAAEAVRDALRQAKI